MQLPLLNVISWEEADAQSVANVPCALGGGWPLCVMCTLL